MRSELFAVIYPITTTISAKAGAFHAVMTVNSFFGDALSVFLSNETGCVMDLQHKAYGHHNRAANDQRYADSPVTGAGDLLMLVMTVLVVIA